jgi:pimeloyl-ACP methyl ester carboxylesterase
LKLVNPEPLEECGIVDSIQVFGPLYSIEAYSSLLDDLKQWTAANKTRLLVFSYDWRQSTTVNAKGLEQFVLQNLGKEKRFSIVAHSMGGLVSRLYLENTKNNPRVAKIVYLRTPFLGSGSTLGTLSEGWGRVENWIAGGMDTIRDVALSFPGLIELLPRYDGCCSLKLAPQKYENIDIFDATNWKRHGWIPPYYRDGTGYATLKQNLERAQSLSGILRAAPQGVQEVRFAGDPKPTRMVFTIEPNKTAPDPANWHFSMKRGDGTVPVWSAARDERSTAGALVSFSQHSTIFDDKWVRVQLKRELFPDPADLDKPIAGGVHPDLVLTIKGRPTPTTLDTAKVSPKDFYLRLGDKVDAEVLLAFTEKAVGIERGAYSPVLSLKQGAKTLQLGIQDVTTFEDGKSRNQLRFTASGSTAAFAEGGGRGCPSVSGCWVPIRHQGIHRPAALTCAKVLHGTGDHAS